MTQHAGSDAFLGPDFHSLHELIARLAGPGYAPPQSQFEGLREPPTAEACQALWAQCKELATVAFELSISRNFKPAVAVLTQVRNVHDCTIILSSGLLSCCVLGTLGPALAGLLSIECVET